MNTRIVRITRRQHQALVVIADHVQGHGFAPTFREIGVVLGIASTNGVSDHLRSLERNGLISRQDRRSRTISLTDDAWALLGRDKSERTAPRALPTGLCIEAFGRCKLCAREFFAQTEFEDHRCVQDDIDSVNSAVEPPQ